MRTRFALAAVVATSILLTSSIAMSALPTTVAIQGSLLNKAGGPVTDGTYGITFALYTSKDAKAPAWSEIAPVIIHNGHFEHALGSVKPFPASLIDGAAAAWIGAAVAKDPELPRAPLQAVMYARRAAVAGGLSCSGCVDAKAAGFSWAKADAPGGVALKAKQAADLQCTGCVSVAEIAFDADVDMGGQALKVAKLVAKDLVSGTVSGSSFIGDGSKLTGIKMPAGQCKAGHAVGGIAADGGLVCVPATAELPADGLATVSNGVLTNIYSGDHGIDKSIPIPDADPIGISAQVQLPDLGTVKTLAISVDIDNSDISGLELTLYDPSNKAYTLHKNSGTGKKLTTIYPAPTKPVSGDLVAWAGKNPKGTWRLKVVDS